jgi:hypothetical protein
VTPRNVPEELPETLPEELPKMLPRTISTKAGQMHRLTKAPRSRAELRAEQCSEMVGPRNAVRVGIVVWACLGVEVGVASGRLEGGWHELVMSFAVYSPCVPKGFATRVGPGLVEGFARRHQRMPLSGRRGNGQQGGTELGVRWRYGRRSDRGNETRRELGAAVGNDLARRFGNLLATHGDDAGNKLATRLKNLVSDSWWWEGEEVKRG